MSTNDPASVLKQFGVQPLTEPFADTQRLHLSFRNERTLYQRTCDATGEPIISIYAPESSLTVYAKDYWYSDSWNPLDYGQDFDFSRPFFEQFNDMHRKVPRVALFNVNAENSDYCNMTWGNKNCYLIFGGDFNEDCMYGTLGMHNRDSLDIDYSDQNEQCYELTDCEGCYNCQFAVDSKNCKDCYFVSDCVGSSDCILSTNLINKQYYIENVQYSKEEYFRKKQELFHGTRSGLARLSQRLAELRTQRSVKYAHIQNSEDCVGDYIKNSKGCHNAFEITNGENMTNVIFVPGPAKDYVDCTLVGHKAELLWNAISITGSYKVMTSFSVVDSANVAYSQHVLNSKHIFGCAGVRQKQYCILNKQYLETDYHALRERIVAHMKETGEWGQFFPAALSDFAYNESAAHNYFPLSRAEALAQGYRWKDGDEKSPVAATMSLPDRISDVSEDVLQATLQCETCHKNYRILPQELGFYLKQSLPIPAQCADCRHKRRMEQRTPRQLWTRQCPSCAKDVESSYAPDRPERVLCETCYVAEIY